MKEISLNDFLGTVKKAIEKTNTPEDKPRDYYAITQLLMNYELPKGCPFKAGDFVTPKDNGRLKNVGEPCRVFMVFESYQFQCFKNGEPLELNNMIIAMANLVNAKDVHLYLADSNDYEPYRGIVYGELEEQNDIPGMGVQHD